MTTRHRRTAPRRRLLRGGLVAALSLLAAALLSPAATGPAAAQELGPDDPSIEEREVALPGSYGIVEGRLVTPVGADEAPAVIVIHDRGGLGEHAVAVARRLAKDGFLAMAVNMLSTEGGTPSDVAETAESVEALPPDVALDTARAAANWMETHPASSGEVGAVGFGWGGALASRLAAADAPVMAVVAYYAEQLPPDVVAEIIDTQLLLHYAALDEETNAGLQDFLDTLEAENKDYEAFMYEDVGHGFADPTAGEVYRQAAAEEAYRRTVEFLRDNLDAGPIP